MSLDTKQAEILATWARGEAVKGINVGDIDIRHAMSDAVTGPKGSIIGAMLMRESYAAAGIMIELGIKHYARQLAATLLGCSDIETAEAEEKQD